MAAHARLALLVWILLCAPPPAPATPTAHALHVNVSGKVLMYNVNLSRHRVNGSSTTSPNSYSHLSILRRVHSSLLDIVRNQTVTSSSSKEELTNTISAHVTATPPEHGADLTMDFNITNVPHEVLVPFITTLRVRATETLLTNISYATGAYVDQITHSWMKTQCTQSQQNRITWESAHEVHEQGNTELAIVQLTNLLACASQRALGDEASAHFDADVYNMLGYVIREAPKPDYSTSETFYLRALQLKPLHTGALSYLGELYAKTGRSLMAQCLRTRLAEVACARSRAQRRGGGGSLCPDLSVLDGELSKYGIDVKLKPSVLGVSAIHFPISTALLLSSGVLDTIASLPASSHTLFLPSDSAWHSMMAARHDTSRGNSPSEFAESLRKSLGEGALANLLLHHMHRGSKLMMSDELKDGVEMTTLSSMQEPLSFYSHGTMTRITHSGAILLPDMMDIVVANAAMTSSENNSADHLYVLHGISAVLQPALSNNESREDQSPAQKATKIDWLAGFDSPSAQAESYAPGTVLSIEWTGNHNVLKITSKENFDACDFSGATLLGATSPVLVQVPDQHTLYLACDVASHCKDGQKLAIIATTASSGPVERAPITPSSLTTTTAAPQVAAASTTLALPILQASEATTRGILLIWIHVILVFVS